jgi:hypothetical protein
MPGEVSQDVLDGGLEILNTEVTHICLCASEPTSFANAAPGSPNVIGYKFFDAGGAFGDPSDHSISGRYVASTAFTDGTIVTTGTARWWCVVDAMNERLLAHNMLKTEPHEDFSGAKFTMASFKVIIPQS